jgi:hypothetical protein
MRMSAAELVRAAMTATGSSSPTELARAIGLQGYSSPRNIKRWLDGENDPDFHATLQLLEAAGMLAAPGEVESSSRPGRALDDERLADALEQLADLQERQAAVLDALLAREDEPARPQPARKRRRA